MICHKCGKESVDGALYCEWCGAKLNLENEKNEKYIIYKSKKIIFYY